MNTKHSISVLLLVPMLMLSTVWAQTAKVENVATMEEFVKDWQISKDFTLAVARAMPAEYYSFKPNPEEMSFGEQMVHIANANAYRFNEITGIKTPFEMQFKNPPTDKDTVMKLLEQSFDYVIEVLPRVTPEQLKRTWELSSWKERPQPDGRAMMMNMLVHTAHHRAQCEVYLRIKGIKPPDYQF